MGKDKDVVDPDPDKIFYSRRKERSSTTTNITNKDGVSVQFPVDGWSTALEKMPMFTRLEMNSHIMKSGKSIADKEHHTVPTALVKAQGSWMTNIWRIFSVQAISGIFLLKASAVTALESMTNHTLYRSPSESFLAKRGVRVVRV